MEAVLSVLSEAHALIISNEPKGLGWLLGLFMGLFYLTVAFIAWGLVKAIRQRDVWAFIRPIETITRAAGMVSACIVPILAVLIVYEVVSRYAFRAPTYWAFEISYMLMGTTLMLAIGFCSQLRRHIRVDFLYDNVSEKKQALIDLSGYVFLLLPMLIWCSWGLFVYFLEAYKVNEVSGESAWNPIIWPFKFMFTFGFYLFTIQTVAEVCKNVLVLMGRDVPEPEMPGGFN
jgi:TRAP-type mannitol/chloroaromatic compound transport system permease small subunit